MENVFDVLKERGFVHMSTDDRAIRATLGAGPISCYIGFDPTADSLHVGSLVPIMTLVHMQRAGHQPIAIMGGGTALVGDPSGKTEMRRMITPETIKANALAMKAQLERFITFEDDRARMINNADWLAGLNYIEFLRDVGRHFSVNRMLTAESVKLRLETGLSFLEFNYMILQAYDFYVLMRDHGVTLQMGGQDQWGNIVAGIDLIRRMLGKEAYGLTMPLITNASGQKFGKTEKGTVWLDAQRTSPYEFYQFWRNTEDGDVGRFLGLFTLLPNAEVRTLGALEPPLINRAKEILAFEATCINHGEAEARAAYEAAVSQFGSSDPSGTVKTSSTIPAAGGAGERSLPTIEVAGEELEAGIWIVDLLVRSGACKSKGEGRRLLKGGGVYLDDERVADGDLAVKASDLADGTAILRVGKKRHYQVVTK